VRVTIQAMSKYRILIRRLHQKGMEYKPLPICTEGASPAALTLIMRPDVFNSTPLRTGSATGTRAGYTEDP
jgi:hypothetical protein